MDKISNIILKSLPIFIVILLLFAACNYIVVNYNAKNLDSNETDIIPNQNKSVYLNDTSNYVFPPSNNEITNICNCHSCNTFPKDDFFQKIMQIEKLKKYLFDANTITFLVTLVIVLLIGFIIGTQKEIRQGLDDTKNELQRFKEIKSSIEEFHEIYVRATSIYLESCNFQRIISTTNYVLTEGILDNIMETLYRMYRTTRAILSTIHRKNLNIIKDNYKGELLVIIYDTINTIGFDRIFEVNPENTGYLMEFKDKLEELRDVISSMKAKE